MAKRKVEDLIIEISKGSDGPLHGYAIYYALRDGYGRMVNNRWSVIKGR